MSEPGRSDSEATDTGMPSERWLPENAQGSYSADAGGEKPILKAARVVGPLEDGEWVMANFTSGGSESGETDGSWVAAEEPLSDEADGCLPEDAGGDGPAREGSKEPYTADLGAWARAKATGAVDGSESGQTDGSWLAAEEPLSDEADGCLPEDAAWGRPPHKVAKESDPTDLGEFRPFVRQKAHVKEMARKNMERGEAWKIPCFMKTSMQEDSLATVGLFLEARVVDYYHGSSVTTRDSIINWLSRMGGFVVQDTSAAQVRPPHLGYETYLWEVVCGNVGGVG